MIPQGLKFSLKTFFRKKKNFWEPEEGETHFYLSRSSWSILAICLLKRREINRKILNVYIPEYFCGDPILLIDQENINICYYPIDSDFKPDLTKLNLLTQSTKPDIFLAVHYFGKPLILNEIKNLCLKFNSWYIEDATHCLKKDKIIGKQGDFVLFSHYKHLAIPNGALMISRSDGPSKLKKEFYENLDINSFLKKEITNLELDKRIIDSDVLLSTKWFLKKLVTNLISESRIFANYNLKKYFDSLKNDLIQKPGGYKISLLSKFLIPRNDLDHISNLKKRNFNVFKEILSKRYKPYENFDLKQNYFSYAPYLFPIEIICDKELYSLIKVGFPIIRWPIYINSRKGKFKKYNNLYFILLNHTISIKYFKTLINFRSNLGKVKFERVNKIDYSALNDSSNINLLQSNFYTTSKADIENKNVQTNKILINDNLVGFFHLISKKYLNIFSILRINRGPILLSSVKLNDRINIYLKLLKIGDIFKLRFLSLSPDISFNSIESLFLENTRSLKLNIPNWKSLIIDLEKSEMDLLFDLKPKWRNSLRKSQKQNLRILHTTEIKEIESLLEIYINDGRRNFQKINPYLIKKMKSYESNDEKLHVFKTFKNGVDIGAILISRQLSNIIYLIGWSSEEGRKLNVNYLLLWEALIHFKSNGIKTFDLGGLIGKNHPIDFFKLGMNGKYYENSGEYLKL